MDNNLVLACYNNHIKKCGDPPQLTTDSGNKYFGYFQNGHGEQWVYVYDYSTDKAIIMGGDAGWDNTYSVTNGRVLVLNLNKEEQKWLEVCWEVSNQK